MNIIFAVNVVLVINIAIHKAFSCYDFVNKLFIAKMFLAKKNTNIYENKSKFIQIKSKKVRHNHCNLSIYVLIIHILIKSKKIFYNNLGICRVIICFTVDLCITKK